MKQELIDAAQLAYIGCLNRNPMENALEVYEEKKRELTEGIGMSNVEKL